MSKPFFSDSYIARHDAQFEELLSRNVQLEEIRAYILLRHSLLSPEDKKRVIVESGGDLKYKETIRAVRLLGSRFFGELQNRGSSGNRALEKTKVYDVNMAEGEPAESAFHTVSEEEPDDDEIFAYFFEQCDEDAIYVAEFEDGIVESWRQFKSQRWHRCSQLTKKPGTDSGKRPEQGAFGLLAKAPARAKARTSARKEVAPAKARESGLAHLQKGFRHQRAGCAGQSDIGKGNVPGT